MRGTTFSLTMAILIIEVNSTLQKKTSETLSKYSTTLIELLADEWLGAVLVLEEGDTLALDSMASLVIWNRNLDPCTVGLFRQENGMASSTTTPPL